MKKIVKEKSTKVASQVEIRQENTIQMILAQILTCSSDEKEYANLISKFSVADLNNIAKYIGEKEEALAIINKTIEDRIKDLQKDAADITASVTPLKAALLKGLEQHNQKTMMTPDGWLATVAAARASSEFTCTIREFIAIMEEAGHSDALDATLKISKTAAKDVLGASVVNRITTTIKKAFGSVSISRITSK